MKRIGPTIGLRQCCAVSPCAFGSRAEALVRKIAFAEGGPSSDMERCEG